MKNTNRTQRSEYSSSGKNRSRSERHSPQSKQSSSSHRVRKSSHTTAGLPRPPKRSPTSPKIQSSSSKSKGLGTSTSRKNNIISRRKQIAQTSYIFQNPANVPSFTVQTVDVANRTAFERISLFSRELHHYENVISRMSPPQHLQQQQNISPSLQHLKLLEKIYNQRQVRQINWNTAICQDADPFSDYWNPNSSAPETMTGTSSSSPTKRKLLRRKKIMYAKGKNSGMYISIDPIQHLNTLPSHAPILSCKKYRLPMRSDVGFPGPSEMEVRIKQDEIQKEAELEEASPRIVVLASKDMIGSYPHEVNISSTVSSSSTSSSSSKSPYKHSHAVHNPTSMFAPPIDATPSTTYGWRSRPFWDRPPGMKYLVVSPLDIVFDVGEMEPLVCSLALYCLPPLSHSKRSVSMDPNSKEHQNNIFRGKISEDFIFPAGDWDDSLQEKAAMKLAQQYQSAQMHGSNFSGGGSGSPNTRRDSSNWKHRKRKALFSFDPNALLSSSSSSFESLFIVLQIHKVTQSNALQLYTSHQHSSSHKHRDMSSTPSKSRAFGKSRVFSKKQSNPRFNIHNTSKAIFENFGTQHLTPIAFGIAPVKSNSILSSTIDITAEDNFQWPNGNSQTIQLHSFPDQPESQEDFVRRLSKFVDHSLHQEELTVVKDHPSDDMDESTLSSSFAIDDSSVLSTSFDTSKKSMSMFSRRGGRKKKYAEIPKEYDMTSYISNTQLLGSASLFVSSVGVDFTQVLLQTPEELISVPASTQSSIDESNIKLLVDISGDCAILLDPYTQSSQRSKRGSKRSDLSRLPPSEIPSEYSDSFDVKEVLYLPPRTNKGFDSYVPAVTTSFLNLLYLYPRLLRLNPDQNGKTHTSSSEKKILNSTQFFSVRISLVQQIPGSEETTILRSIYNSAPGGDTLLESIYTKIPHSFSNKKHGNNVDMLKKGLHFRDEVKVRLPTMLSGGHFLHFSLFSIGLQENHVGGGGSYISELLEENWIPLSNNTNAKSSSGTKVTTIIPNALHRIKLGSFLLQLETRLVSSIHNSDPAVAIALRDFPFNRDIGEERSYQNQNQMKVGNPDICQLLKNASEHALVNQSQPLLLIHILNILNCSAYKFDFHHIHETLSHKSNTKKARKSSTNNNPEFTEMISNMISMFAILKKVKTKFLIQGRTDPAQMNYFFKFIIDSFDEDSLRKHENRPISSDFSVDSQLDVSSSSKSLDVSDVSMNSKAIKLNQSDKEIETLSETVIDTIEEMIFDASVKVILQQETKNSSGANQRDMPFSRRAYGISKTDRMRAEAELVEENRYAKVFDDDETVFTVDTLKSRDQFLSRQLSGIPNDELSVISELHSGRSVSGRKNREASSQSTLSRQSKRIGANKGSATIRDKVSNMSNFVEDNDFVKRVNLFAQVVIAPCMGPTLSNSTSTGHPKVNMKGLRQSALISNFEESMENQGLYDDKIRESESTTNLFYPGSDLDDEEFLERNSFLYVQQPLYNKWVYVDTTESSKLRGIHNDRDDTQLEFSYPPLNPNDPNNSYFSRKSETFLYESIFTLWLEAWKDAIAHSNSIFPPSMLAYVDNIDFLFPLCLKSIALRCTPINSMWSIIPTTILDKRHMDIFEAIMKICARGVLFRSLDFSVLQSNGDETFQKAIDSSNVVIDFITGLLSVIHPAQVSTLIDSYLKTLQKCDQIDVGNFTQSDKTQASLKPNLQTHLTKCSLLLRLRAIEKLSIIPGFVSLNYPLKHKKSNKHKSRSTTSWMKQHSHDQFINSIQDKNELYSDGLNRIPKSSWLINTIASEAFHIFKIAHKALNGEVFLIENHDIKLHLTERDELQFETIAEQSITFIYESLIRRHAMDSRFQTEAGRGRLASMYIEVILQSSFSNLNILRDIDPVNRVRTMWILSFLYVLQEVPEGVIRHLLVLSCSFKEGYSIYKFIELLKLSTFTCQGFIVNLSETESLVSNDARKCRINAWLVQESFNTICAGVILLVDECAKVLISSPVHKKQIVQGIFDLLLLLVSIPQTSVTHLRALGGASHAFDKFGAALFIEVVGDDLQHWARIILTLMNGTALSVRSIAVDFIVSIFGGVFDEFGNVDELALVFLTVIPEVVAREIGMNSISGQIKSMHDVECVLWPLRRALADVEDTNPLDDDRVDVQLVPFLVTFCRTCQAIIDGVVIELRLMEKDGSDIIRKTFGSKFVFNSNSDEEDDSDQNLQFDHTFDADEESLFEASNFFQSETAPLQRLRWLITLKSLHEFKGQWVEAAEVLLLCARTIAEAIPHIKAIWRPSRFDLWHDASQSLWLSTLGYDQKPGYTGNTEMMKFAIKFLEPPNLLRLSNPSMSTSGKLFSPTISVMCKMLTRVHRESVQCFLEEEGLESLAFLRLEQLLKSVMEVVEDHAAFGSSGLSNISSPKKRTILVEESAALRKMSASLNGDMTKLAERMLLIAEEGSDSDVVKYETVSHQRHHYYVRVVILGRKPDRFKESTAIPTFLEWGSPSICRVAKKFVLAALLQKKKGALNQSKGNRTASYEISSGSLSEHICSAFAEPLIHSLAKEIPKNSIVLTKEVPSKEILGAEEESNTTYLVVNLVHMKPSSRHQNVDHDVIAQGGSKRFYFRNRPFLNSFRHQGSSAKAGFVELTVANLFPCGLSRQRTVITSEYFAGNELLKK